MADTAPDPTPEEIAQRSAKIREAWTDHERAKRAIRWARAAWLPLQWVERPEEGEPVPS